MRFVSSLLVACTIALSSVSVNADLRLASQPKQGYVVKDRNAVNFVTEKAIYLEPSDFAYNGLKQQRNNAYDNFLRSNIDNEQDKRNFATEAGKDMLPFRTMEAALTDIGQATVQNKIGAVEGGTITTAVATKFLVPLRWNNPHASELEVNIWIAQNKYVVPISLPTCAGEGHQDAVFEFQVPADFLDLPAKVPGFTGCKAVGDCVLQVYAHSVETRQYAIGTPIIITGQYAANSATTTAQIQPAPIEVGKDITKLRQLCLSGAATTAGGAQANVIPNAVPQVARQISDVYNHAYQNSDYSPYSGQQPLAISQNLQAAAILSMTTGNRGELGKAALPANLRALAAQLEAKQKNIIKQYEGVTNKIINKITNTVANGQTAALGAAANQKLATAFRSLEVGSVTTTRLQTNTYVPSFTITNAAALADAKAIVAQAGAKYANLINNQGTLQIYVNTLKDMAADFKAAAAKGIDYLPAALKPTAATLADTTGFKKIKADGTRDNGQYATAQAAAAYVQRQAQLLGAAQLPKVSPFEADITELSNLKNADIPPQPFDQVVEQVDPNAMMADDSCDSDDAASVANFDKATGQPKAGACSTPSGYLTFGNEASLVPVPDTTVSPTGTVKGAANTNSINTILVSLLSVVAAKFIKL